MLNLKKKNSGTKYPGELGHYKMTKSKNERNRKRRRNSGQRKNTIKRIIEENSPNLKK